MSEPLRFGVMGTGNIARQFAQGVAGAKRSTIAAVGSRKADTAKAFADQFDIPRTHDSYEALLDDAQVDAIYLSLPNSMHCDWTIRALEAGKHVLCEKPLAVNTDQAKRMFDAAERCGRVLIEAFMYRTHPQTAAVLEQVRSGAIGELQMLRLSFSYRTTVIDGNVRFSNELAGGALMDIGCYCIDFACLLADSEVEQVAAVGRLHETGIDDLAAGSIRFANGVVAGVNCGMSAQTDNAAYVCGTDGYIAIPVPWKPPVEGATFTVKSMTPPRMDKGRTEKKGDQTYTIDTPMPLYGLEADAFAATVLDGAPPFMPPAHSIRNMQVLDEMRQQIGLSF